MASNDQNAAGAANEDLWLTMPQATNLLQQGALLCAAHSSERRALAEPLGLTEGLAEMLMSMVEAGVTPGHIVQLGLFRAADLAEAGLKYWPASEAVSVTSELDGSDLFEIYLPPRGRDGKVIYFAISIVDGVEAAVAMHPLDMPIQLGLVSVEAGRNRYPAWGQYNKDESNNPWLQRVRAKIARMQAQGLRFDGAVT